MTELHHFDRQKLNQYHPFTRLRALLDPLQPGVSPKEDGSVVNLSIGEPQTPPPVDLIEKAMQGNPAGWAKYPLSKGIPDYLNASAEWLTRRYALPEGFINPDQHIIAVPGTREGLFFTALSVLPAPREGEDRPVFLVPNPSYHVYIGAAAATDCEVYAVPATRESGYLPDYSAVPEEILKRTKLCVLCTPSNPEGAVARPEEVHKLIELARRYDFVVCFDECYAEIYFGTPPHSSLETAAKINAQGEDRLKNILAFHSLSKRSGAAGLRCGFIAGDQNWITRISTTLQVGGAGVPQPAQAAGAALWRDEDHVVRNRKLYEENFRIAGDILGEDFNVELPAGGFCLWLDVGNGVEATLKLWQEAGIRVMPGAYMSLDDKTGFNPGAAYIRLALVYDTDFTRLALERLRDVLKA
ncbi:aminotransferase class I/II-fold pyridoxal phosphate-dependent enzyme [Kiloniella sp. b19]|uniref:aminotransferase class I/II-fold pyridoxal phosphate-dependent enzyme n=1 Tax=Kiloniella sp. GXU_MW_B19 TaxID=3141326 RepID=UPI0031D4BB19